MGMFSEILADMLDDGQYETVYAICTQMRKSLSDLVATDPASPAKVFLDLVGKLRAAMQLLGTQSVDFTWCQDCAWAHRLENGTSWSCYDPDTLSDAENILFSPPLRPFATV
ncbi:MAG: hypothetical protein R3313_00540 [Candidatus Saccharimonadales bacterium]|nr:hypothetical protein [Candidatus Saccharimonadales bacterium]